MPALRRSFSMTNRPITPFCCASPPLVVVRRMPSDTSNTWKMMIVPMSAMAIATISSTMLMPRAVRRLRIALMASVRVHGGHHRVVVGGQALRGLFRGLPEDFDLHRAALAGDEGGDGDFRLDRRRAGQAA